MPDAISRASSSVFPSANAAVLASPRFASHSKKNAIVSSRVTPRSPYATTCVDAYRRLGIWCQASPGLLSCVMGTSGRRHCE